MLDFQGKFQEVLDIGDQFVSFAANQSARVVELNEFEAHLFLEAPTPSSPFSSY